MHQHSNKVFRLLLTVPLALLAFSLLIIPSRAEASYLASDVLGQLNFTSALANQGGTASSTTLSYPEGVALDSVNHRLFVSDSQNHRVLEYGLDSSNSPIDRTADHVLGQPNMTSVSSRTISSTTTVAAGGLTYDSQNSRLFVTDNSRVLVFDLSGGITDGMAASHVIGQADFASAVTTASATTTNRASGVAYDPQDKTLFVSDFNHNRVLTFDLSGGITDGMAASHVLGQADFVSSLSNRGGSAAATTMRDPLFLSYDQTHKRLFVDDDVNLRVLTFDLSGGITDGMAASHVIGQASFTSTAWSVASTTSVGFPEELAYDSQNDRLIVADDSNLRTLIFDLSGGITDGMAASAVIGQTNFTSNTSVATQDGIADPEMGMDYDPVTGTLYEADSGNNRVMVWKLVHVTTSSMPDGAQDADYSSSATSTSSQGTLSYSISSGALPTGLSLDSSTGAITGTSTAGGTFSFTIRATDNIGVQGVILGGQTLSITIAFSPSGNGCSTSYVREGDTIYAVACGVKSVYQIVPSLASWLGTASPFSSNSIRTSAAAVSTSSTSSSPLLLPRSDATSSQVSITLPSPAQNSTGTLPQPAAKHEFSRNLARGSKGADVLRLQQVLRSAGLLAAAPNGYFGPATRAALIRFQKAHGLPPTGFFGPLTRGYANSL